MQYDCLYIWKCLLCGDRERYTCLSALFVCIMYDGMVVLVDCSKAVCVLGLYHAMLYIYMVFDVGLLVLLSIDLLYCYLKIFVVFNNLRSSTCTF